MSGRDLRSFVTSHRIADTERMVRRAREGVRCASYRPLDYERLQSEISERKLAGQEALMKLKCIKTASHQQKEESRGKQHCIVWLHELSRLSVLRQQLQSEVSTVLLSMVDSDDNQLKQIFQDFSSLESVLADDFLKFKENTTDAVWSLRSDLEAWMHAIAQSDERLNTSVELDDAETVLETIELVKEQQSKVMDQLSVAQQQLEAELHINGLVDQSVTMGNRSVQSGIPEEAFNLECPDLELKASVLQQFILLDGKYVERLNQLEEDHCSVLSFPTGGWSADNHDMFLYVMESYTNDIANRRLLYIDCLQRCLPHKTRSDVVDHEEWWNQRKFYYQRRRDVIVDWLRDRTEFLNRVKNVFYEACMSRQLEDSKLENRQKQNELCDALYAKVHEWRVQKMEAFRLEQELAEAARLDAQQARMTREEKEKMHREKQKAKISEFREKQAEKRKEQEIKDRQRLEQLQNFFQEQAAYDLQRIKFREQESQKKLAEKEKRKEELRQAEDEKERILEAIRQKVRPHVEGDLLRLWSDTAAWQARQKPEEFMNIQQPLFDINTFTANQIMADPRVRVEQRLRDAGLQTADYARQVMTQVHPVHPPRRDAESTIFK